MGIFDHYDPPPHPLHNKTLTTTQNKMFIFLGVVVRKIQWANVWVVLGFYKNRFQIISDDATDFKDLNGVAHIVGVKFSTKRKGVFPGAHHVLFKFRKEECCQIKFCLKPVTLGMYCNTSVCSKIVSKYCCWSGRFHLQMTLLLF